MLGALGYIEVLRQICKIKKIISFIVKYNYKIWIINLQHYSAGTADSNSTKFNVNYVNVHFLTKFLKKSLNKQLPLNRFVFTSDWIKILIKILNEQKGTFWPIFNHTFH